MQQHKNALSQPGSPQNGTEFYENLSHDYGCIPDAITADEKAYRENYIKTRLESVAKSSPLIKKLAEQRGLIAKEENSMEQE